MTKTNRYKIFLDLDTDAGITGSLEFVIQGTRKQIMGFLGSRGYQNSHFTIEKLPPLITFNTFKKIVEGTLKNV